MSSRFIFTVDEVFTEAGTLVCSSLRTKPSQPQPTRTNPCELTRAEQLRLADQVRDEWGWSNPGRRTLSESDPTLRIGPAILRDRKPPSAIVSSPENELAAESSRGQCSPTASPTANCQLQTANGEASTHPQPAPNNRVASPAASSEPSSRASAAQPRDAIVGDCRPSSAPPANPKRGKPVTIRRRPRPSNEIGWIG